MMEFACYTCDDCGFEIYQVRSADWEAQAVPCDAALPLL